MKIKLLQNLLFGKLRANEVYEVYEEHSQGPFRWTILTDVGEGMGIAVEEAEVVEEPKHGTNRPPD
jgi:hypothetical protein